MTAADCLYRAATDRFDEGDFCGALELAHAGLQRDWYHPGLLQMYGLATHQLGAHRAALQALETAGLVAPLGPLARLALADLYMRAGMRKRAATELAFLAEQGRCPTPLLADLARLFGGLGAYRAAFKICRRLAALRRWYHPAHYGMAYYLAKLKKPVAKAIPHLRAALALAPQSVPYRVALAGALAIAGAAEEACDVVRSVPAGALHCASCLNRLRGAAEVAGDAALAARLRDRLHEVLGQLDAGDCSQC